MIYHNRILRPSYYVKSIIKDNDYFDHCYDCTYFSYIVKNYIKHFSQFSPFKTNDVYEIMRKIVENIRESTDKDTIKLTNNMIRKNIK